MAYKKYEKYKNSGVEWIGEIPEGWEVSRIKYTTYCLDGKRVPLSAEQRGEMQGDIPYWGANCIIDYVNDWLIDDEVVLLGEDGAPFFDRTKDVAFYSNEKIWPNNHVHVLKTSNKINAKFLVYYLNIVDYTNYVNGSTREKLTQSDMGNIPVLLPPTEEQTAIANFLDQKTTEIDSLIADKEKLIQLLQEKRQAIITEAVTKGLDPNIPMKDSGVEWIGKIPEHWNITRVKYICSESAIYGLNETANNYEDEGVRLIRTTDINEYGNLDDKINGVFISEEKAKGYILKTGDILVSRSGSLGLSLYFDEKKYGKCSYASYLVKFRTNRYNHPRYLFYFTKSESFYHQIQTALVSSTISNFNGQKYANMELPLPSYHEQKAIANFLDQKTAEIDSLISDIQNQIAKLKEYRQSLIYEAVTGKIDVRDFTSNTEGVVLDAKNTN